MKLEVKICGISDPVALDAAVTGGARLVGFVFFPRSPRNVAPSLAAELVRQVPTGVRTVGLFVDPTDAQLQTILAAVPLDVIQLHGDETPERVAAVRSIFARPLLKAVKVATAADVLAADRYVGAADRLLFDAKPPTGAALPGGNGVAFDWSLLHGATPALPWMLSGGLTPDNLVQAVTATGAVAVDVSSGVEDRPGHKDPGRIRQFLNTARQL